MTLIDDFSFNKMNLGDNGLVGTNADTENDTPTDAKTKEDTEAKIITPPSLLVFFYWCLGGLAIAIFLSIANISLIYYKNATPEQLNKKLPVDCSKLPYGTSRKTPCHTMEKAVEAAFGFGNTDSNDTKTCSRVPIPYKWYSGQYPGDGSAGEGSRIYLDWLISSLAQTQTKLHKRIRDIFGEIQKLNIPDCWCYFFIVLLFCVILLPFIFWYSLFSLGINQSVNFLEMANSISFFLAVLSCILIITSNVIISIFNTLKLFFILLIQPWLENNTEFKQTRKDNSISIGFIVGGITIALWCQFIINFNPLASMQDLSIKIICSSIPILCWSFKLIQHLYRCTTNHPSKQPASDINCN